MRFVADRSGISPTRHGVGFGGQVAGGEPARALPGWASTAFAESGDIGDLAVQVSPPSLNYDVDAARVSHAGVAELADAPDLGSGG